MNVQLYGTSSYEKVFFTDFMKTRWCADIFVPIISSQWWKFVYSSAIKRKIDRKNKQKDKWKNTLHFVNKRSTSCVFKCRETWTVLRMSQEPSWHPTSSWVTSRGSQLLEDAHLSGEELIKERGADEKKLIKEIMTLDIVQYSYDVTVYHFLYH